MIKNDRTKELLAALEQNKESIFEKIGSVGLASVISETPVRTGELRDANQVEVMTEEDAVVWFNDKSYAPFVEYGTYKMNPNPFMLRGLMNKINEFSNIIINGLKI